MYKLKDWQNKEIDGAFYEPELQLIDVPEKYRVEKILRSKTLKDGSKRYRVKWLGYPRSANSWVDEIGVV